MSNELKKGEMVSTKRQTRCFFIEIDGCESGFMFEHLGNSARREEHFNSTFNWPQFGAIFSSREIRGDEQRKWQFVR